MRIAALAVLVCLLGVLKLSAQSLEGLEVSESATGSFQTSETNIPTLKYRAGKSTVEVQAGADVDVRALIVASKIRPNDAPDVIVEKIDAARQRLFPDKEIGLTASVPRVQTASAGVNLWRYYVYWNRRTGFYAYWSNIGAAVTVLGRVLGTWDYWECNGCSSWRYKKRVGNGGSLTYFFYGGSYTRGFKYQPLTSGSKADIIMYFFY